jgi:hypothetical protein
MLKNLSVSHTLTTFLALGALFALSAPVHAQQGGESEGILVFGAPTLSTSGSTGVAGSAVNNSQSTTKKTVGQIVKKMSEESGIAVVADSTVASVLVEPLTEATTPANLEQQIGALAKAIGKDTQWARLFLPEPSNGGAYNGDDVADFAMIQARLFRTAIGNAPNGSVEVLGKTFGGEKAQPYVAGLDLKPVYLLTNPRIVPPSSGESVTELQWNSLTEEQKQAYASQHAARLANADPSVRQAFFQQHMAVMGSLMRQLPPDQRNMMFTGPNGNVRILSADGVKGQRVEVQGLRIAPAQP